LGFCEALLVLILGAITNRTFLALAVGALVEWLLSE
jgi:hypothetical protein